MSGHVVPGSAASETIAEVWQFFDALRSTERPSNEEMEAFYSHIAAALEESEELGAELSALYRTFPSSSIEHTVLTSIMVQSPKGRDMLTEEAQHIMATGQIDQYPAAFEILANFQPTPNRQSIELAMRTIASTQDQPTLLSALNYIDKVKASPEIAADYQDGVIRSLQQIVNLSDDPAIQRVAAQKLYDLTSPQQASMLATEFLRRSPSQTVVLETLSAIRNQRLDFNPELQSILRQLLTRPDVTDEELLEAQQSIPEFYAANIDS